MGCHNHNLICQQQTHSLPLLSTQPHWGCILMTTSTDTHYICMKRSAMSMKWVGCLNHSQQHDTSEKSSESLSAATVTVRPSIYQAEVASL